MWPKWTYSRSPVTTGVGLAGEFFSCIGRADAGSGWNTSTSQRLLPSAASKHKARSDRGPAPSPMAVVRYTRPPDSTGDDHPRPATGAFHATFFVGLHSTGTPVADDTPWPVGPRNCGQSSATPIDGTASAARSQPTSGRCLDLHMFFSSVQKRGSHGV
jgi:hypothetical protein